MNQRGTEFFVAVSPTEVGKGRKLGGKEIQLLYRVGGNLKLLQVTGQHQSQKGQIMGIDSLGSAPHGDVAEFCRQVMSVLDTCGYGGVCCLFQEKYTPTLGAVVQELERLCAKRGALLLVPELYGATVTKAVVFLSSALSGGTLEGRFARGKEQFGRVAMDIEPMAEDLLLPSPSGAGVSLTPETLRELIRREKPSIFFSTELCARYFTYQNMPASVRLVLFDDEGTLHEKTRLAKNWNLCGVIVSYAQSRILGFSVK